MVKKIAIVLAVLLLGLLTFAATRPDSFRVQRTLTIHAPPEKIYPLLEDFHRWNDWSPYQKLDPSMRRTLSGAERGKGAVYEWDGNAKAGKGRMEITNLSAPSRVTIQLDFTKPFEAHNTAEFTLQPRGETTDVTWAMYGPSPFATKLVGVFLDMDRMIGRDFEAGLANLKALAET